MTTAIWVGVVAIGGVGAVLRFVVDRAVSGRIARAFPVGTLASTSAAPWCWASCPV
jgi:CrcB protein